MRTHRRGKQLQRCWLLGEGISDVQAIQGWKRTPDLAAVLHAKDIGTNIIWWSKFVAKQDSCHLSSVVSTFCSKTVRNQEEPLHRAYPKPAVWISLPLKEGKPVHSPLFAVLLIALALQCSLLTRSLPGIGLPLDFVFDADTNWCIASAALVLSKGYPTFE